MAILHVHDLTLKFGGLDVIDRLSFDVEEGAIVSLIGPNGAGKTSVFNCLTGFYRANAGDIRFQGQSIMRLKPHRITKIQPLNPAPAINRISLNIGLVSNRLFIIGRCFSALFILMICLSAVGQENRYPRDAINRTMPRVSITAFLLIMGY